MLKARIINLYGEKAIYYKDSEDRTITLELCVKKLFTDKQGALRKNIEKIIVDTWEGKLVPDERSDDKILTSKDVEDVIYKYRNEEFYDLGNIKNQKNYLYKEYINICRGEDELRDDE